MKNLTIIRYLLPGLFLIVANIVSAQPTAAESQQKLDAAFNIITSQYVDKLDSDVLVEDAIQGILKKLDPHSVYIPSKRVEAENQKLASEFEGVGIQFNILNDTIIVISAISGGPSEKLGIMAGDKIIEIDSDPVAGVGIDNEGVRDRLLGKKGTKVDVKIKRKGVTEPMLYTVTRDKIPLYSIDAMHMVDPTTGYIKVNRFSASTTDEFGNALKDLKKEGMQNLILDLTGNGGGYLYAAFEMADEFLGWGKMIVYTEGEASPKKELRASSRGSFEEGKLVVLIDEGSASASEIVSGAVQDWDRGLIIGRRSFGKGLVQKPYRLADNSEIRLTIARYYTPTGRSIQKPYDEGREEYYTELQARMEHGELFTLDSISFPDSLMFLTPNNRTVFGGGGIMPDIFIPVDTMSNTQFIRTALRQGLMNEFVLTYVDEHRKTIKSEYKTVKDFKQKFDIEHVVPEFLAFAASRELVAEEESLERSAELIRFQLKALIARNLWDIDAFYQVYNDYRRDFRKAMEVISDEQTFKDMRVQSF